ncbi:hypothetical protein EDD15DRAFT_2240169 [Pisolithus albus]|nr:hypothetical protein EDD15DRAFT_2240169 [Pisolithus albus]
MCYHGAFLRTHKAFTYPGGVHGVTQPSRVDQNRRYPSHTGNGSWFSSLVLETLMGDGGWGRRGSTKTCMAECNTNDLHYGFDSFDESLVKKLKTIAVTIPDATAVVNSACSSTVHDKICHTMKKGDHPWIQSTPYLLSHILAGYVYTKDFVGGTVTGYAWIPLLLPLA